MLEFLHEMHPRQLEVVIGQLLDAIGFEDVEVTRYSGDSGIDAEATLTVGGVTKVKTAVQVKRWRQNVSGSTVRELRGSLTTDQQGLIITTAGFTKDAKQEASALAKSPISLIDGKRLVELLAVNEIGVRRRQIPVYELNLAEFNLEEEADEVLVTSGKSAVLWSLPGGQKNYFETLLEFLEHLRAAEPTREEMVDWIVGNYEKVASRGVARSYLRASVASMGLIELADDSVRLTSDGTSLLESRDRRQLLRLLRENVSGVEEILEHLAIAPASIAEIRIHLIESVGVSWETDVQVNLRLQWLSALGAVRKDGRSWRLTEADR